MGEIKPHVETSAQESEAVFCRDVSDGTVGLPFTQKPACGERADVRRAGQLLICHVKFNSPCKTFRPITPAM